jgi:PHD/YefM family antitoxin component YafN of YafNO toxin-antitoxin module
VVLSEEEYADLLDELELLRELNNAQSEVAAGETVSQEEAIAYLRSRFGG